MIQKSKQWITIAGMNEMLSHIKSSTVSLHYDDYKTIDIDCTLKSPYNNTQKLKYNSLDRRARKFIKLNVPSIEDLANHERVLLVKRCLCKQSNKELSNYFKLFEHKYKTRNNPKSIKLPLLN